MAPLSSDDYRLVIESIVDYAIFMLDPSGRIVTWNAGAEQLAGYTAGEIIGEHCSKFYPAEDVASGKPVRELELASEVGRYEEEGWRIRKDGGRFLVNMVVTAFRDERGELRGFSKIIRDLTRRHDAEERLRRSEERFHHLIDAVTDYAFFSLDSAGYVQSWNTGAEKIKGYAGSEIIGQHFSVFYRPEDRALGRPEHLLEIVRRDGRVEDEGWRLRKDGSRFWANVIITALRNEQGALIGFAKVTRDLTERHKTEEMERDLIRAQAARTAAEMVAQRAEEANRIKDEFLATVSHELRTPLNAIVGWSSMLGRRELEPSIQHAVDVIARNARAQARIVDDILDVSRITTGKLQVDPKPTDLGSIVRQAIEVIRHSAAAKQITITFRPAQEQYPLVGDPDRLQQVVWNLLSNAIKFTDPGGMVRIDLSQRDAMLSLSVTDTGIGIDAGLLPFVFERFRQGDSSTTRRYGGLGLGLALVRHIVELHGGTVSASSNGPGQGSTFTLALPFRATAVPLVVPEPIIEEAPLSKLEPPGVLAGLRVLVVDDDADANELVTDILTGAGAIAESADSAPAALEALPRFRPHLLLSDIGMPGEDGYSLIRRVRALSAAEGGAIPAIALTAYSRREDRTKALAAGFTTHIGKPVRPADLVAALTNLAASVRR